MALLVRPAHHVQTYESLVHFVRAVRHHPRILHVVSLPVTEFGVIASFFEVGRFSNDQLTHFVDEVGLPAGQEPQQGSRLQALSNEELLQVHLLSQCAFRVAQESFVARRFHEHLCILKATEAGQKLR